MHYGRCAHFPPFGTLEKISGGVVIRKTYGIMSVYDTGYLYIERYPTPAGVAHTPLLDPPAAGFFGR